MSERTASLKEKFERDAKRQAPEKPKVPTKPADPKGENVGASKQFFEAKIRAEKPKGKTDFFKDRFERKIEKQKEEAEAANTYAPRPTNSASNLAKKFEKGEVTNPSNTKTTKIKANFEQQQQQQQQQQEESPDANPN
jgi:hypothetical protein